jgi:hypothetical protein
LRGGKGKWEMIPYPEGVNEVYGQLTLATDSYLYAVISQSDRREPVLTRFRVGESGLLRDR